MIRTTAAVSTGVYYLSWQQPFYFTLIGNRLIRLINKKPYPAYCTAVLQRTAGYQTRLTGNP